MANYQLIYTSSKRGYGVFSQSTEIRPDESRQITITTAYRRPQALVNSNEDNLAKYPINFTRFKLANGKWVLAQSTYIGLDNTGRQGNFFTHALLFPKFSELTNDYLYFEFRKQLSEEEREQSNPSPLGTIQAPVVNLEPIKLFAKKNATKVPLIIQAFLDAQKNRKKLVITDSNENTILWIKLLFDLLPKRLTEELEFTSYADRLTSAFEIVGIYDLSVIRDTSRTIIFNGKEYNSEISELAKSLSDDYINEHVNHEFMFFSSFMKSSELLTNIYSLYATLSSKSVEIDEIFDLLRGIPTKDKTISDSVIDFVLTGNYLNRFSPNQVEYLLRVTAPSENTAAYNDFIYQLAFNGNKEKLDVLNKNIRYSKDLIDLFNERDVNVNTQYFVLNLGIKKNIGRFVKNDTLSALRLSDDISRQKKDWIQGPLTLILDQIIEFFPFESYQDSSQNVLESDMYDIIKDIQRLVGSEVISNRAVLYVKKAIQSSLENNEFSLILRNVALISSLIQEMSEVVKPLRGLDTKEQSPVAERVLYLMYIGLTNSRIQDNLLRESYSAMFPVVQMLFDLKSYYGQKKLLRTYSDLVNYASNGRQRNGANFVFKKNYFLYSILGTVSTLIVLVFVLITIASSPSVTLIKDPSITIRSSFFSQELNTESDELIAFSNSSDEVLKTLADEVRSKYTLEEGFRFGESEVITSDNEIRFVYWTRERGLFNRPSFYVSFDIPDDIDLESSPKILVDGNEQSGVIRKVITFSEFYNVSVEELVKDLIGEITIEDATIDAFKQNESYNRLFDVNKYSSGIVLTNPDLSLIDIEILNIDDLQANQNKIDITRHSIDIIVVNALGQSTNLELVFTFQPSITNLPLTDFVYFERFEFQIPYSRNTKDVTRKYLNDNGVDFGNWDNVDVVLNEDKDTIILSGINGLNFKGEVSVVSFTDTEDPSVDFATEINGPLEFDWLSFKDKGSQSVYQKVSELIGEFEIFDDSLRILEENEYLLSYFKSYSNVQTLQEYNHPLFTLATNIDEVYEQIQSGVNEIDFSLTLFDSSRRIYNRNFSLVLPDIDTVSEEPTATEDNSSSSTESNDQDTTQESTDIDGSSDEDSAQTNDE
jgi:hypothetical protein